METRPEHPPANDSLPVENIGLLAVDILPKPGVNLSHVTLTSSALIRLG